MSCPPYFTETSWASIAYHGRPWLLNDYSIYEQVSCSAVPYYVHPKYRQLFVPDFYSHMVNPFVLLPPWSPFVWNRHQRQSNYRYTADGVNTAVETNASRISALEKSYITQNSSADAKAVFNPHQLSPSSFERTTLNKSMANKITSDLSDASALEQRGSRAEKNEYKSTVFMNTAHKPGYSEKKEINDISSECQAGANSSISSQSCYVSTSELNLTRKNLTNLSLSVDEESESLCKEQYKISIPPEYEIEGDVKTHIDEHLSHFTDSQNDCRFSDVDDDSQLEYHSAEEQDCVCHGSLFVLKTKTSEISNEKELANEDKLTGDQPGFNKFEGESSSTSCSICSDYCSFSETREISQKFQGSHRTTDCYMNSNGQERDETVNTFHSVEDSFSAKASREENPRSCLMRNSQTDEKMKANSLTDTTSKVLTNRGLFKNTDTGVSERIGNTHVVHQERTFVPAAHTCTGGPDISDCYAHEQSDLLNIHEVCTCKMHGRCKENFPNSKLNNIMYLSNIANKNHSTVNQAVDAASDFRACFTTSRATNVKASMMSRAQNTVITMMSKHRPNEWLTASHRSVACNTDWSCLPGSMETNDSQIAITDMLENSLISDTTKHGWNQKTEDPLECKDSTSKYLNEIPNRLMQLSEEITDHLPICCKKIWQRAIKAEMQLLKMHYMCHQHCWQTNKERKHVNSSICETRKSMSQVTLVETLELSSNSLVTHQLGEKRPSDKNAEETKNLVKNGSSDIHDTTEDWFDATENLAVGDSSLSCTEKQTVDDRKQVSKTITYVRIDNLGPLVSEVDLWLNFQKYNVSEISICEESANCRYASLSFKSAHDASLAVKEMNKQPIRGKPMKVQLLETDAAENCSQLSSVQCIPSTSTFVCSNAFNLRSFSKIVKKLEELHPEASRNSIFSALMEVKESKGLLSGLSLTTIVQTTSSLLSKKFPSKSEENQDNNLRNK